MPFVLVIIGILVAIGLGGYYVAGPKEVVTPTDTPIARVEESATATDAVPETAPIVTPETPQAEPTVPETAPAAPAKPTPAPTPTPAPKPVVPVAPVPKTVFKNATYNVTTSYVAPGRTTHDVNVTLTIANDVVTGADVTYSGDKDGTSSNYQKKFSEGYKTQVIGKSLGNISLSRVGGASLTTNAFNKAIAEVVAQARL